MRSVAVTGARGLIGELIVKNLFDAGWKVKVLTRSDRKHFSPKITLNSQFSKHSKIFF